VMFQISQEFTEIGSHSDTIQLSVRDQAGRLHNVAFDVSYYGQTR
jgi:hypothetical protein